MRSFTYHNATSIEDALGVAGNRSDSTAWLAGGTDLLGILKDQVLAEYPAALVDLKTIPGLDRIESDESGIRLGALARLSEVARHPDLQTRLPALVAAAEAVATPELRNMGTLGGNLCQDTRCWYYRYPHHMGGRMPCKRKGSGPCHAVRGDNRYHVVTGGKGCFAPCPSDTAVALAALDARLTVASPDGQRSLSVGELYTPMGHVLGAREILTGVHVPAPSASSRQAFRKFTVRKPVDFAVVSVAALVTVEDGVCREARLCLGGVAPAPLRTGEAEQALAGQTFAAETIAQAAERILPDARPMSGNSYKLDIARSLVREVLRSLMR